MSPVMAHPGRGGQQRQSPVIGHDRTCRERALTAEFDPLRNSVRGDVDSADPEKRKDRSDKKKTGTAGPNGPAGGCVAGLSIMPLPAPPPRFLSCASPGTGKGPAPSK